MTGAAAGECAGLSGLFIGLMSGTSIDAVDGVLVRFDESGVLAGTLAAASLAMPVELRRLLTDLQQPGADELARAALAGNRLADLYAQCVQALLAQAAVPSSEVVALGAHGQTVRHDPAQGFTIQLLNGARLAEASCIDTVAALRSADIAAGGQGAPLVPTFHARVFGSASARRAIVNIGGIANVTVLERGSAAPALGFDTGPGNTLMDAWCERHRGETFDRDGAWAAAGRVDQALLGRMLAEPYFSLPAPKSTGRDLFNPTWLDRLALDRIAPVDVQATLLELTARSVADALRAQQPATTRVIACGGGVHNPALMAALAARLPGARVESSAAHGLDPDAIEAMAFAWLARETLAGRPGNLASVTGAAGPRILGAIHPA